jgi:short-subunit dehydrogenase
MPASAIAAKLDMSGRRVLITGAAGGLGTAFAQSFKGAGATLLLADKNATGLDRLQAALGGDAKTLVYDQADLVSLDGLARAAGRVDILINNAGILLVKMIAETTPEEMRDLVMVDLVGPMILTKLIASTMAARGDGVIINISSQLAFCGSEGGVCRSEGRACTVHALRCGRIRPPGRTRCGHRTGPAADHHVDLSE